MQKFCHFASKIIDKWPKLETKMYLIWKKYQVFTPIAERLLEMLKAELSE